MSSSSDPGGRRRGAHLKLVAHDDHLSPADLAEIGRRAIREGDVHTHQEIGAFIRSFLGYAPTRKR